MGIPYSREINKAFDELNVAYGQVTPLIEAAYEVLETTKNISLLLLGIQVLTVILLAFILLALVGLMIVMNPEMDKERRELVTPTLRWVTGWMTMSHIGFGWFSAILVLFILIVLGITVMTTSYGTWVKAKVKEKMGGQSQVVGEDRESEAKDDRVAEDGDGKEK